MCSSQIQGVEALILAEKGSRLILDLRTNAFRVLGLETNAPLSAPIARRNELVAHVSLGRVPPYPSDYVIFAPPERTLETVAAAVQRLEDPRTRLLDEATWFHLRDSIDAFAARTLSDGNSPQARALWEGAVDQATDPVTRQHYQHNLAVLHLCTAEIPAQSLRSPRKIWDRVLTAWTPLLSSYTFWRQLADESPARGDARFHAETPAEVRTSIGLRLAQASSRRAAEALADGRTEDAWDWATAPFTNQFPAEFTAQAEEEVIEAVAHFIRTKLEPVQDSLREEKKRSVNVKRLEPDVLLARNIFEQFRLLGSKTSPALVTTADLIAETLQQLGIHYNNTIKDYAKALQATEDAVQVVASEGLRIRLRQDIRIYQWNIAQAAFWAAKEASNYEQALTAFKELERYVDPTEGPKALNLFRDTLKDLLLKKELRRLRWENAVLKFEAAFEGRSYDEALAAFQRLEQELDPTEGRKALDPFRGALKNLLPTRDPRILRWNDACAAFEAAAEAKALAAYEDLERYADPTEGRKALDPFQGALEHLRSKDGGGLAIGAGWEFLIVHEGKPSQRDPNPPHSAAQEPKRGWGLALTPATAIVVLLAVVIIGLLVPRYFLSQTAPPSSPAPGFPRQPAQVQIPTTPLKGVEIPHKEIKIPEKLSIAVKPLSPSPKIDSSAPGAQLRTIVPAQPSIDRSALLSEIERRRSALKAEDAALEAEQVLIGRERAAIGDLRADIEAHYGGYPNGLPPDVYARYEVDVAEDKQRVQRFDARVQAHNARVTALKRADAEFNALVNQYNASR